MSTETLLPIVTITGPTASGKTELALALHDRLPVRLISVDSAQVYRGLDIGTAKPDSRVLARYPHALIDIADPAQSFSAAEFLRAADAEVAQALAAGQLPVLVGGTMMYLQAFREGLAAMPPAHPEVRAQIDDQARCLGWGSLYQELQLVDPEAAARIDANNHQRIQRALEVYRVTGLPMTQWWRSAAGIPAITRHGRQLLEFSVLTPTRAELHSRIALRFDAMLAAGFVDEVEQLRQRGDLHPDLPAMRAVGYRQVWHYLAGQGSSVEMRERGIAATRQLAKRQLTWLRRWTFLRPLSSVPVQRQVDAILQAVDLANIVVRPHSDSQI